MIKKILEDRLESINAFEDRLNNEIDKISAYKNKFEDKAGFTEVLMFEEVVLSTIEFLNRYRAELENFLGQANEDISFEKYSKVFN